MKARRTRCLSRRPPACETGWPSGHDPPGLRPPPVDAEPRRCRGLAAPFAEGRIRPDRIVAIFGKTEGNGCVNDWTRALASRALRDLLVQHVGIAAATEVCLVMSGGTEGGLAPHITVFEAHEGSERPEPGALSIGRTQTADLPPEHLGRLDQVAAVAAGVGRAMRDAGIDDPADVHFVQVKCPLLTSDRIAEARRRGADCATTDTLKSMGLSRAASALGVAVALGEVEADASARR